MMKTMTRTPELDEHAPAGSSVDPTAPIAPEIAAQVLAYLAKPYHLVIQTLPEGGYGAWVTELPNCIAAVFCCCASAPPSCPP